MKQVVFKCTFHTNSQMIVFYMSANNLESACIDREHSLINVIYKYIHIFTFSKHTVELLIRIRVFLETSAAI